VELREPADWIQFQGSKVSAWILRILGWKVFFHGLPTTHGFLIVYPHTSNVDFLIGQLAKSSVGFPVGFLAKDSLFKIPLLGAWMRYLKGKPIVRNSPQGYVQQLSEEMAKEPFFWIVITPEGTRKATPGWRSGFYHLALKTGYPLGLGYIDYAKKEIGITDFVQITGNEEKDMLLIQKGFEGKVGRFPENASPIQIWTPPERKKS
jgi:1-acyl-sn-glycerol-3-phosphate acyltransferase